MPASRIGRTMVGIIFIIGGILGFLPVLGFWMIPLGLLILSHDFPSVRRFRRNWEVKLGRWWQSRKAARQKKREEDRT
ncbi:PGPGW domain-containing protein [Kordiimonas gwangyangensis]|uniref:PGPGW domain-containing protein n=1 Tax=Kordiimonas gwangyangensis TaxID=288022 RepID=UPI000379E307